MTVADRLVRARAKLKKTQVEMAAEIGCHQPEISKWESGDALPSTANLRAIAKAYRIPVLSLLPEPE